MTAASTTSASHHPTQTGNGRQAQPQPAATTTTMLDFNRKRGRELLAACADAEDDRSLFNPTTMATLYGRLECVLGQLLDELDASDEVTGGAR